MVGKSFSTLYVFILFSDLIDSSAGWKKYRLLFFFKYLVILLYCLLASSIVADKSEVILILHPFCVFYVVS